MTDWSQNPHAKELPTLSFEEINKLVSELFKEAELEKANPKEIRVSEQGASCYFYSENGHFLGHMDTAQYKDLLYNPVESVSTQG